MYCRYSAARLPSNSASLPSSHIHQRYGRSITLPPSSCRHHFALLSLHIAFSCLIRPDFASPTSGHSCFVTLLLDFALCLSFQTLSIYISPAIMSGKLDQSLDEILSSRRHSARRGGRGAYRHTNTNRRTVAPPVGGIKKNHATTRNTRGAGRQVVPSGPADGVGASKIIVSNLVSITSLSLSRIQLIFHSLACRCERGSDQGMLNLRQQYSWTSLASSRFIFDYCELSRAFEEWRPFFETHYHRSVDLLAATASSLLLSTFARFFKA